MGNLGIKNESLSCEWYKKAADFANPIGQFKSAKCYKYGPNKVNYDKAINLFESSINQKTKIADKARDELLNSKINDKTPSCDWYEKLHQKNYSEGTYEIAMCYRYEKGRAKNLEEARKLFEYLVLGEKLTDLKGKYELADMYLKGLGGEKRMTFAANLLENIINSPNSTKLLIQLAGDKIREVKFGWPECHTELSKADHSKAKKVCLKAAENTEICAMLKVSELYEYGHSGFKKDKAKYKEWKSKVDLECGIAELPHTGSKSCSGKCEPPL